MEISEYGGDDTEVDSNSKYDICSDSMEHEGFDHNEPYLEETLPQEDQGYPDSIVDDLYDQLDDYKFKRILGHYFKDGIFSLEGEVCW